MANRSLLTPRVNILPEEYPELHVYRKAVNDCMWFHDQWTFSSDKNDYQNLMTNLEKSVSKRGLICIAQIEIEVKRMWAEIYHVFKKPEIDAVGVTFAESEVRHQLAYRRLLEELKLQDEFLKLKEIPCLIDRVNYLKKHLKDSKNKDFKKYVITLTLFSLFIENSSLFGQFGIFKVINKEKGYLKDTDNVITDTTKEENIHALFGVRLIRILQEENPEIFPENFRDLVVEACIKSAEAESKIIDWIFEKGDLPYLSAYEVKEYVKYRLNYSLGLIGIREIFTINEDAIDKFEFFEVEQASTIHVDFFHKKSSNYDKHSRTLSTDELF